MCCCICYDVDIVTLLPKKIPCERSLFFLYTPLSFKIWMNSDVIDRCFPQRVYILFVRYLCFSSFPNRFGVLTVPKTSGAIRCVQPKRAWQQPCSLGGSVRRASGFVSESRPPTSCVRPETPGKAQKTWRDREMSETQGSPKGSKWLKHLLRRCFRVVLGG